MNAVLTVLKKWNLALGRRKWNMDGCGISRRHFYRLLQAGRPPEEATLSSICSGVWDLVEERGEAHLRFRIFEIVREVFPSSARDWKSCEDLRFFLVDNLHVHYEPTKLLEEHSSPIKADEANGLDEFFPVLLYPNKSKDNSLRIRQLISSDASIPFDVLYSSPRGAARWIAMCEDGEFHVYRDSSGFISKNKNAIIDSILDGADRQFNFVSMGPGNGQKDKSLLLALVQKTAKLGDVNYYPFDINPVMVTKAWQAVGGDPKLRNSVATLGFVGDFSKLSIALRRFRSDRANLFLLLGNTLGNMEKDAEFVRRIESMMKPGDRFVVEVRLKSSKNKQGGSDPSRELFNFSPLEQAGVIYKPKHFEWKEEDACSQISGTKTLVGVYGPYDPPWDSSLKNLRTRVTLIHHYDPKKFRAFLRQKFDVVGDFFTGSTGIFVLKQKSAV